MLCRPFQSRRTGLRLRARPWTAHPDLWPSACTSSISRFAPGDYFIHVNGKSEGCGSDDEFTVLPGLSRHIEFPTIGTLILGPSCSVAGRLPLPGLSVRLITASGTDLPVAVDGDGYYSQTFGRGKLMLEIGMMQGAKVDIPLDYSDQQAGEFCDKKIVRNITLDDLRKASAQ